MGLSRMGGGDVLLLARARDRVLSRLARGLSVERDVPTFLRFGKTDRPQAAAPRLAEALLRLPKVYLGGKRRRARLEAPLELTAAYVSLTLAWGLARLGETARARTLRQEALTQLDARDPVHDFLMAAYGARIDQALEGLPIEAPLPPAIAQKLEGLERLARYKVDRLRQTSTLLEPQERLDPFRGFLGSTRDARGPELAALRGIADLDALALAIAKHLEHATATTTSIDERARLFDGLMDFLPLLAESQAAPMLEQIAAGLSEIPPVRRAVLAEEALMLAGHFGRSELATRLISLLEELVSSIPESGASDVISELSLGLRGLRRVGLREEAAGLIEALRPLAAGDSVSALLRRVQLAQALSYLGHNEAAFAIEAEAAAALGATDLLMPERLQLVRALAGALAQGPIDRAIPELEKLASHLGGITDQYATTSTHFCLSVLNFMEALVLGYVNEDLALGETARRWLEEDEYLVRRRIHRDLGALSLRQKEKRT
jgi:hypothetical protein